MTHSTPSTPEWASVPLTVTSTGAVRQPIGNTVVSAGATASMLMTWSVQSETLPATSTARVRIRCGPFVESGTFEPLGPFCVGAPSRLHSTWSTPDVMSTARTSKLVGARCQPLVAAGVVAVEASVGSTVSIRSVSARQPDALPE